MCNGNGHIPGCDCGFGPKEGASDPVPRARSRREFQGRVRRGKRTSWWDQAVEDADVLKKGLSQACIDRYVIDKTVRAYQKDKSQPASTQDKKKRLINLLKEFMGVRKCKIEKTKTKTIKVPLFTFGAPSVDRSKVIYEEKTDFAETRGWVVSLVVPGIGMGSSQEFKTTFACQFSCECGEFKTIFVPVRIRVSKLGIYERGTRVDDGGLRITAEGGKSARNYRRGIESCKEADCRGFLESEVNEFLLSGNKKKNISKYTDQLSRAEPIDISIGLDILGVKTALQARVSLQKEIKLEYDLPGGYDYQLYQLKKQLGIGWKVLMPRKRKIQIRGKAHGHPNRKNRKARAGQFYSWAIPLHQKRRAHPRSAGRSSARH